MDRFQAKEVICVSSDIDSVRAVNVEVAKQLGFFVIHFSTLDFRLSEAILYVTGDQLQELGDSTRESGLEVGGDGFDHRVDLLLEKLEILNPVENVMSSWVEISKFLKEINSKRNDLLHGLWRNFGDGLAGVTRRRRGSAALAEFQPWPAERIQALVFACIELNDDMGAAMSEQYLSDARIEYGLQPQPHLEDLSSDDYTLLTHRRTENVRAHFVTVEQLDGS